MGALCWGFDGDAFIASITNKVASNACLSVYSEALLLLYGLMDSAPPAFHQESFSSRPEFAELSMDKYMAGGGPTSASQTANATTLNNDRFQPAKQTQRTEVDSLEDSFKFAVGIAAPMSSSSTMKAKVKAAAANRSASRHFGSHASFEVPEEVLLRDVLYALQAIDSRYLYFDVAADRFQITRSVGVPTRKSTHLWCAMSFMLCSSTNSNMRMMLYESAMRELIHKLCELGWFYRKIAEYLKHHREELSFGVVRS